MSLSLYLECPHCKHAAHRHLNITHNVHRICKVAGCDPWEWDGLTVAETLPSLDAALTFLGDPRNEAALKPLEPENGWGSIGGTRRFLRNVWDVAKGVPDYPEDPAIDVSAHRWRVCK